MLNNHLLWWLMNCQHSDDGMQNSAVHGVVMSDESRAALMGESEEKKNHKMIPEAKFILQWI